MKRLRHFVPFVLGVAAISCTSQSEFSDPDLAFSTSLIHAQFALTSLTPLIFLIVADDANTPEAAELRARLPNALRQRLLYETRHGGTCENGDPARWHPGDARVVIARPSAPGAETLFTWVDMPNLAWITNTSKKEEIDAIVTATAVALEQRLAKPGEPYRPLRAAARSVDLISGVRAPEGAEEHAFLANLPKWFSVEVLVASTRSDEDVSPIESLLPVPMMNDRFLYANYSVIGPSLAGGPTCTVYPLADSRLENWAQQMSARFFAWPCNHQDTWDNLMLMGGYFLSCGIRCHGRPFVISPDGSAQCRAFIDQPDLDACDPARGWSDPAGVATFATRWGIKLRQCEIAQHSGDKLDACRHSLECPNCGGGFCATEVPELVSPKSHCPDGEFPWPLRFTGGSIAASGGLLHVYCDTGVH